MNFKKFLTGILLFSILFNINTLPGFAENENNYMEAAEERKNLPIETDNYANWPAGPQIGAEAAILMDADTGVILYGKNMHEKLAPASTTKIMTALLAMENGKLEDTVTFSYDAVFSVPRDASNMGMDQGQSITLEQCLYGIMVGSANEAANAAAEYVSGSIDEFVDLMNNKAASLGCTDTHFANANGLYDENHYTSVYDLCLISREFFSNEMLCKIGNTPRYHFEATETQPDDFYLINKHQLINGEVPYEGIIGGKTGYTDLARQTLVTCAEKNGMKLICIVFMEESPYQFSDTVKLFDYGFQNFQILSISDADTKYNIKTDRFFQAENDIFGKSSPILQLEKGSYVIVPNMISVSDLDSKLDFSIDDNEHLARIDFFFNDAYVGNTFVNLVSDDTSSVYEFKSSSDTAVSPEETTENPPDDNTLFINVKKVVFIVTGIAGALILFFIVKSLIRRRDDYLSPHRKRNRVKKHRRRSRKRRLR